jgi:acyl carrier protein
MTQGDVEAFIISYWKERAAEKGLDTSTIGPSTILLQSAGADSLELAILVAELETFTGRDPFSTTAPEFQTIQDLARFYVG